MNRYQVNTSFQRSRMLPPVIKWLLIINVIAFLLDQLILPSIVGLYSITYNGITYTDITPLTYYGGLWPINHPLFMPWQYVTTMFLHGGFLHIAVNMFVLWMFGMEIGNLWGTKRFAVFYLLSGLGASFLHTAITAMQGGFAVAVGASGAIAGVVVAYSLIYPDRLILFFFIPMRAKWIAPFYIGISLLMGIQNNPGDNIAHFAHLGGALAGFLLAKTGLHSIIANRLSGKKGDRQATPIHPPKPSRFSRADKRQSAKIIDARFRDVPEQPPRDRPVSMDFGENQEQIDMILDKISRHGYQNLTQEEKDLLTQASRSMKN